MYRILLMTFLMSLPNICVSQNFLEIGNQWLFETKEFIGPGVINYQKIDSITITKDTIINNKSYFKLEATVKELCWVFLEEEYLREEENKIYRLSRDKSSEYLMIDFEETDSYQIQAESISGDINGEAIIDSFGITLFPSGQEIETQYLRIINNESFDDDQPYKVHHKIGFSNPGILYPNVGTGLCDNFFSYQEFKCFISEGDTIQLTERDCFEFEILEATNDLALEQIDLHPNPSRDFVVIPESMEVQYLQNVHGQKQPLDFVDNKLSLELFHAGTYIVLLKNTLDDSMVLSKIVKI